MTEFLTWAPSKSKEVFHTDGASKALKGIISQKPYFLLVKKHLCACFKLFSHQHWLYKQSFIALFGHWQIYCPFHKTCSYGETDIFISCSLGLKWHKTSHRGREWSEVLVKISICANTSTGLFRQKVQVSMEINEWHYGHIDSLLTD